MDHLGKHLLLEGAEALWNLARKKKPQTIKHSVWTIAFDLWAERSPGIEVPHQRLRAAVVTRAGFSFKVFRSDPVTELGKIFGMQDVTVGDETFDRRYIVQSNDVEKVKALLSPRRKVRAAIRSLGRISFQQQKHEDWLNRTWPEHVRELTLDHTGPLDEEGYGVFERLFTTALDTLVRIKANARADSGIVPG